MYSYREMNPKAHWNQNFFAQTNRNPLDPRGIFQTARLVQAAQLAMHGFCPGPGYEITLHKSKNVLPLNQFS
jgi:hypothetical protein